jgi:hypothetical protein
MLSVTCAIGSWAPAGSAGVTVFSRDLDGFKQKAGSPPVAIDFDALDAGTDIGGRTLRGITFRAGLCSAAVGLGRADARVERRELRQKRVMGLEPTTFTLATCAATGSNEQDDKYLDDSAGLARSAGAARGGCPLAGDAELAAVVAAWPAMPVAIRRAVMALVGCVTAVAETKTPAGAHGNDGSGDGDAGDADDRDVLAGDSNTGVAPDAAGGGA